MNSSSSTTSVTLIPTPVNLSGYNFLVAVDLNPAGSPTLYRNFLTRYLKEKSNKLGSVLCDAQTTSDNITFVHHIRVSSRAPWLKLFTNLFAPKHLVLQQRITVAAQTALQAYEKTLAEGMDQVLGAMHSYTTQMSLQAN